ncbi:DALR anticodon-binding domain-containing protein 3 [Eufriesea mexicana]|nr:DALR anticodon-binding domain-containing protein 3 [Eufriesea mexicana]
MEIQMENTPSICIQLLINNITSYLSGNVCKNSSIVKVNNENLAINGELYFLPSLKVWKSVLKGTDKCDEKCTTILQHCLHIRDGQTNNNTDADTANQVLQLLIASSSSWSIKLEKCFLEKERIFLFLQRTPLIENSIKAAITFKHDFGKTFSLKKVFSLKSLQDKESELTTTRLYLIQCVTEKILNLHGYSVSNEYPDYKFVFTSKSQGSVEENYERCICGVVKNTETNCKETKLTWQEYISNKIKELKTLNEHKYFETEKCNVKAQDCFLENIAKATAMFELLSVKPTRSVFIGCNFATDKNTTNTKGACNTKFCMNFLESLRKQILSLLVFRCSFYIEEWELIYNFVIGYQQMIKDCLKHDSVFQINPQVICIFLAKLCQKFSIYYRRIRILTEVYDHLIPTMSVRLYMLHALQIVLQNALGLLDILPVSRM